ncbi:MAG: hypothetical protein J5I90_04170 [Caldilineales bacterium]|nr:hypothetical protein [Caldilineales bacterium]
MDTTLTAVEVTGTVDEKHQLVLDSQLPISGPKRVRVIVLYALEEQEVNDEDWLRSAASNPAFADLHHHDEDIYTLNDGRPIYGES